MRLHYSELLHRRAAGDRCMLFSKARIENGDTVIDVRTYSP